MVRHHRFAVRFTDVIQIDVDGEARQVEVE
jgi:hypothetical protein